MLTGQRLVGDCSAIKSFFFFFFFFFLYNVLTKMSFFCASSAYNDVDTLEDSVEMMS